ncbi:MAG: hypothetical protein KDD69_01940 [Bdellovibrionales bacterium]|nr:hypothetical protein [Bdellovibrionales bacterium]
MSDGAKAKGFIELERGFYPALIPMPWAERGPSAKKGQRRPGMYRSTGSTDIGVQGVACYENSLA